MKLRRNIAGFVDALAVNSVEQPAIVGIIYFVFGSLFSIFASFDIVLVAGKIPSQTVFSTFESLVLLNFSMVFVFIIWQIFKKIKPLFILLAAAFYIYHIFYNIAGYSTKNFLYGCLLSLIIQSLLMCYYYFKIRRRKRACYYS